MKERCNSRCPFCKEITNDLVDTMKYENWLIMLLRGPFPAQSEVINYHACPLCVMPAKLVLDLIGERASSALLCIILKFITPLNDKRILDSSFRGNDQILGAGNPEACFKIVPTQCEP